MKQGLNRKELLVVLVLMICVFLFAACNPGKYLAPRGVGTDGNARFSTHGNAGVSAGDALMHASDGNAVMLTSSGNILYIAASSGNAALASAGNAAVQGN